MRFLSDLLACLRFYSRLPVPVLKWEAEPYAMLDFAHSIRALPIAGLIIATPAAALLYGTAKILPPEIAAGLALALFVRVTGAFHEDGLADVADGFGGGQTRESRLEIMSDSRIGTYGMLALLLSGLARWAALTALIPTAPLWPVLIAAGALSRAPMAVMMALMPNARQGGLSASTGRPSRPRAALACLIAVAIALALGAAWPLLIAATLPALALAALAWARIKGQTGDILGAAQHLADTALLITASALLS